MVAPRCHMHRQLKNVVGDFLNPLQEACAACQKDASTGLCKAGLTFQSLCKHLKDFTHSQMKDCVQRLSFNLPHRKSCAICESNLFCKRTVVGCTPFLDFQPFCLHGRDTEPYGNIIREVVASHSQHAALFYVPIQIEDIFRYTTTDVYQQCSHLLLLPREHDLGCRETAENHVIHFDSEFLDTSDGVFDPVASRMDDVEIGLELPGKNSQRILNPSLPVHSITLKDGVKNHVLLGNAHVSTADNHVIAIFFINLAVFREIDASTVVESLNMTAGDRQIHICDFNIGLFFGLSEGLFHANRSRGPIQKFPFPNATGYRPANPKNPEQAITFDFTHDGTDL